MEEFTVKDIMVPLAEYATCSSEATLFEAVMALEKAQEEFHEEKYRHRAILVYDQNKKIVGKVSQMDVLLERAGALRMSVRRVYTSRTSSCWLLPMLGSQSGCCSVGRATGMRVPSTCATTSCAILRGGEPGILEDLLAASRGR